MISKRDILKIESLLFLQAISEAGSKREVAGQLGTSVDTLNKYLSEFEAEMKTKFLISNGRGTVITPEGKRMLDIAQDVVRAVRSMDDYAEEADAYSGVVRLAMPDAIADYIGMREVGEFIRKYPDLSFENNITNEMPDIGVLEADICINYEPLSHPDAVIVATKEVGCGLFASPKYIEEHGMPRDMDDLLANHFIIAKNSHEKYAPGWSELLEKAAPCHLPHQFGLFFPPCAQGRNRRRRQSRKLCRPAVYLSETSGFRLQNQPLSYGA